MSGQEKKLSEEDTSLAGGVIRKQLSRGLFPGFFVAFYWFCGITLSVTLQIVASERRITMTLKEYRQQLGLTQRDLAMHSGISIRTIRDIENHNRLIGSVTVITAVRLARALGVTVEDLTGKVFENDDKVYFEADFEWFNAKETGE